jgi:hypothetical protein
MNTRDLGVLADRVGEEGRKLVSLKEISSDWNFIVLCAKFVLEKI